MVSFSVLIITHGREHVLRKCLDSLQVPHENWELVLVQNGEDLSWTPTGDPRYPRVKLLRTEHRLPPGAARNVGLKECEGDWVHFLDDDAYWTSSYWKTLEPSLENPRIDVLGGPDTPAEGMKAIPLSLAIALSSPFCTGLTFARHRPLGKNLTVADEEKLTSCNLWVRRSVLNGLSFPENYLRTEENKFLALLKERTSSLFYHPGLQVGHFRRSKISEMVKPSFYSGFYRSRLLRETQHADLAFWLPSVFVVLHFTLFLCPTVFVELTKIYLAVIFCVSLGLALKARRFWLFPLVAFFHYFVVFLFGVGFLMERGTRWK